MIYLFFKKKWFILLEKVSKCDSRLNGIEIIGTGKIRIILLIYISISLWLLFVKL